MSIIYEALKKTESREGKKTNDSGSGRDLPLKVGRLSKIEDKKKIKPNFAILFLIFFVGLFFLWNYFSKQFEMLPIYSALKIKKNNFERFSHLFKTDNKTSQEYILNGIVYDNENSSVVINGRLIKEGETINDFVVNDISRKKVKLINSSNNKELVLSLPF